jgi:hypothetical protein
MCDEREPLLAYLYDDGDEAERRRVEAHLVSCETCREELAGLRGLRTDLLAWDVPDHGSVWTPFVPVRPAWRDVPAWVMAVAASLVLALGATSGLAAASLRARAQAPAPAPAPVTQTSTVMPAMSAAELAALEARVLKQLRAATPVATKTSGTDPATPTTLSSEEYHRLLDVIRDEHNAVYRLTLSLRDLSATVAQLQQNQQGGQQQGGR